MFVLEEAAHPLFEDCATLATKYGIQHVRSVEKPAGIEYGSADVPENQQMAVRILRDELDSSANVHLIRGPGVSDESGPQHDERAAYHEELAPRIVKLFDALPCQRSDRDRLLQDVNAAIEAHCPK